VKWLPLERCSRQGKVARDQNGVILAINLVAVRGTWPFKSRAIEFSRRARQ
jgi:hypothetical protein